MQDKKTGGRFKVMAIIGLLMLAISALTYGYIPSADPAEEARCREIVATRGETMAAMADRCSEKAFASALLATDAHSASRQISGANQLETIMHMLSMFLLGLGGVLTIMGFLGIFGKLKPRQKN